MFPGPKNQHGRIRREIPLENARRGEILLAIQTASTFLHVEKVPVPARLGEVAGVVQGRNRKNIFVWLPQHSLERFSRIETKRAVLVMGCVEVAA